MIGQQHSLRAQDRAVTTLLLLVAGGAAIVSTPAEKFWWLAPTVAGIAACLVVWFNWGQHKVRSWRMRRPFKAYLTVAPQSSAGMLTELHVPPNREVEVQFRMYPRLHHKQFHFVFGVA